MKENLIIIGQPNQTKVINNIATEIAGSVAIDCAEYKWAKIKIISTASEGRYVFECSNDNNIFWFHNPGESDGIFEFALNLPTPPSGRPGFTPTLGSSIYFIKLPARYFRIRILDEITGGSIQSIIELS